MSELQGKTYEEACFDAMFAGVRLSSLVTSPHHLPTLPAYLAGESSSSTFPATFPFFSEHFPALSDTYSGDLKMPKSETPYQYHQYQNLNDFHQLPDLHSLEESHPNRISIADSSSSSFSKRPRTTTTANLPTSDYMLEAIVRSFNPSSSAMTPGSSTPASDSQLRIARKRREKIGERAKCLQSLMPWEKKLNMANLLQEAFKYIKFLQAQVTALESMPYQSSFDVQNQIANPRNRQSIASESSYPGQISNPRNGGNRESGQSIASETSYLGQIANPRNGGNRESGQQSNIPCESSQIWNPRNELWRLNRQELLEIMVNSKVAQKMMYSQECCVYSIEQLVLLKKIGQRRFLMQQQQQMMFEDRFVNL